MYGYNDLKENLSITTTEIDCPVKDCNHKVARRQKKELRLPVTFQCPNHKIYVYPSAFIYEKPHDNLLWIDIDDDKRLNEISKVKRESRIESNNSEDAVSWNVFRYLERNNLLSDYLSDLIGKPIKYSELILWSYSPNEKSQWSWLNKARIEFVETIKQGSEPDIIVITDIGLFFIEAKVLSGNKTSGTGEALEKHKTSSKKYVSGGGNWFSKVFRSKYEDVVEDQKYELMRFWLLGTWIADKMNLDFYLYNLVLEGREGTIAKDFGAHIIATGQRKFDRTRWEDIYSFVIKTSLTNSDTVKVLEYFTNKTKGYNSNGVLQKAFSI